MKWLDLATIRHDEEFQGRNLPNGKENRWPRKARFKRIRPATAEESKGSIGPGPQQNKFISRFIKAFNRCSFFSLHCMNFSNLGSRICLRTAKYSAIVQCHCACHRIEIKLLSFILTLNADSIFIWLMKRNFHELIYVLDISISTQLL